MTNEQLAEIQERITETTQGPWTAQPLGPYQVICGPGGDDLQCGDNRQADALFAAHARMDVPALMAENARLRAALECIVSMAEGCEGGEWAIDMAGVAERALKEQQP